jgi:hypothetical protein
MDSSDIDDAIVARLKADAALAGYMPDGVYFDMARPGSKRFVLVTLVEALDVDTFGGREAESALYFVRAVGLASTDPDMKAAAHRIDVLLADTTYPVNGYAFSASYRDEPGRRRWSETDEVDASIRWNYRGAHYRVEVARP